MKRCVARVIAPVCLLLAVTGFIDSASARPGAVKTYNLYLRNYFEAGDAQLLAKWDVLGLDVDTPFSILNEIRSYNPQIKLLAYIPINGTYESSPQFPAGSKWRMVYDAAQANNWWLRDTRGGLVYDHPGKLTTNLTPVCPVNGSGQRFADWFPQFIVNDVLQNGSAPWDGVILDDVWTAIWWINQNAALNPDPIDADRDGVADDQPTLDMWWKAMNDSVTARIRRTMPPNEIITGNGGNQFYGMNGAMIETFPFKGTIDPGHPLGYSWTEKMFGPYGYFSIEDHYSSNPTRINVVNAKWELGSRYAPQASPAFERHKRFCMASCLLRDGYFSLDWFPPNEGHNSLWWFPEYDKQIGFPVGAPYQRSYNGTVLWRRDYTNGVVILNNNYTAFLGSPADSLPPIGWVDAATLLRSEMWQSETVPPAAVTDVSVTRTWNNQLEIQWTNTGDNGNVGQAVGVEIRYSAGPLSEATWATASIVAGSTIPELPGVTQLKIVPGLLSGQTYNIALKTKDLSGNWSPISNVVNAVTVVSDIVPPDAVTNLAVVSTTSSTATVTWISTGDDGQLGTAASFDLRYIAGSLSAANWDLALRVIGEPAPGPAGTVHTMQLVGMLPSTTYTFGIKVADEMPNWSALSNLPTGLTLVGDSTPPGQIADLRVTAIGSNSVTLTWTAPGDDGQTGRATVYDLRYSTNPITSANFTSASFIIGEPGPANAGTTQSMTISGLGVGYLYYFAIRTSDEWPNWSVPSNTVSALTNSTDTTPPAAVTSLAATASTASTVTLSWTAPGDDGSTGTASSYDLRYSTAAITAANFAGATQVTGILLPGAAGAAQSTTVSGLGTGTTYYFALKTADERSNWSGLSNVVSRATSPAADTTPPGAVTNLAVTTITSSSLTLSWTAPGDDGTTGTAGSYDLRYATAAITSANFASATAASGEPAPAAAGTTQTMVLSGLAAGTTYYLALKTADEVPNWSAVSNVPSAATTAAGDITPPAAISDFRTTGVTATVVTVAWTAPGDDGTTGRATSYDMRWSPAPITAANFNSCTHITTEPAPANAGTTQTLNINGFAPTYTYYVALKSTDDASNVSTMSNLVSFTVPVADVIPPAAITDFRVTSLTSTSVTLAWTVPGDDGTTGTATLYDMRWSSAAITEANFASRGYVSGEPVPTTAGTTQSMTISGVSPGYTFIFALKTRDEVSNWSALSNTVTVIPPSSGTPDSETRTDAEGWLEQASEGIDIVSADLTLLPPAPNPFHQATRIQLTIPPGGKSDLLVNVYSTTGRKVRILHSGAAAAGMLTLNWDGRDDTGRQVANGIYFIAVAGAGPAVKPQKVIVAR